MLLLLSFAVMPQAIHHFHSAAASDVCLFLSCKVIVYMHTRPDFVVVVEGAWKSAASREDDVVACLY